MASLVDTVSPDIIIPMPTYPPLLLLRAVGFEPGLIIRSAAVEIVRRTAFDIGGAEPDAVTGATTEASSRYGPSDMRRSNR